MKFYRSSLLRNLFIVASSLTVAAAINGCSHASTANKYIQEYNGSCFMFELDMTVDYKDANNHCQMTHNGTLALVKSADVNHFLCTQMTQRYNSTRRVWIGLNDMQYENSFVWEDGTAMNYTQFARFEGTRSAYRHNFEDCVALDPVTNKWYDYHCKSGNTAKFSVGTGSVSKAPTYKLLKLESMLKSPKTSCVSTNNQTIFGSRVLIVLFCYCHHYTAFEV